MAPLINLIVILVLAGLALWVLAQFPNLDGTIAKLIRIVIVVMACVLVLYYVVGLLAGAGGLLITPPRYR